MSVSGNYGKQNVDGGFLDGVQEPIQDVAQTADRICRGLETIEDGLEAAWGGVKSLFGFGGGEEVGQAGSAPAPSQVEEPAVGSGYADASLTTQLMALANKAGINADDIRKILDKGIGDYDNQGAGAELQQFKSWLAENKDKLSPAALQVAEAYVKLGDELAAKGKTGISDEKWNGMMEEVAAYKDPATTEETTPKETAGTELDKNMCLEDMIFELLMACLKDKREELRGLAEDANKAKGKAKEAGDKVATGDDKSSAAFDTAKDERDESLQKLQRCNNELQEMNQLLTGLMSSFSQANKAIIGNIR